MKAETIRRLLDYLPDRGASIYRHRNPLGCGPASDDSGNAIAGSVWDEDVSVWIDAYKDPAFAWHYVKHIAQKRIPFPEFLPCDEMGLLLRRAYRMESGLFRDPDVLQALALTKPKMHWERSIVTGVLMVRDVPVRELCRRAGLSLQQVLVYERLFFNVLDRADDTLFILGQAHPDGRAAEFFDGYMRSRDVGRMLRRCGYEHGLDELLWMIGHRDGASFFAKKMLDREVPRKLEAMTMVNGLLLARNGFGFQSGTSAPALSAARGMLNAAKQGGVEDLGDSKSGGVADLADAMLKEMKAFGHEFIEKRSQVIQARNQEFEERGLVATAG